MNIMPFNSDLNKQALEVTFSKTMTKSYHSQIFLNNILENYLNEKLNVYHFVLVRNVQITERVTKLRSFYYIQD